MSEKDIPVMFRWETPWRPNEIEQLQANLGLHPGRTRESLPADLAAFAVVAWFLGHDQHPLLSVASKHRRNVLY